MTSARDAITTLCCWEDSGLKETPSGHQFDTRIPALVLFGYFPGFIKTRYFFFLVWYSWLRGFVRKGGRKDMICYTISPVCLQPESFTRDVEGGLAQLFLCGRDLSWSKSCFLEFSLFQNNIKDAFLPVWLSR